MKQLLIPGIGGGVLPGAAFVCPECSRFFNAPAHCGDCDRGAVSLPDRIAEVESRIASVGHRAYSVDDINSPRAHRLFAKLEALKAERDALKRGAV